MAMCASAAVILNLQRILADLGAISPDLPPSFMSTSNATLLASADHACNGREEHNNVDRAFRDNRQ